MRSACAALSKAAHFVFERKHREPRPGLRGRLPEGKVLATKSKPKAALSAQRPPLSALSAVLRFKTLFVSGLRAPSVSGRRAVSLFPLGLRALSVFGLGAPLLAHL